MAFITVTGTGTGRTFHVRAERIDTVYEEHNDDKGVRGTKVTLTGTESMLVNETPMEVLRRIEEAKCFIGGTK